MTAEILGTHHSTSCLSFGFPFSLLLITLLYKLYQSSELKYAKMLVLCFETVLSLTDLLLTTYVSVNVCVCMRLFVCVCVYVCIYMLYAMPVSLCVLIVCFHQTLRFALQIISVIRAQVCQNASVMF